MNLASTSIRIDVIVGTVPAEWWQIAAALMPVATLAAFVIAGAIATLAVRWPVQGCMAEVKMRAEWWDRAEWAMDMALDERPERRNVGLAVLEQLSRSRFMGKEDAQIVAHAMELSRRL